MSKANDYHVEELYLRYSQSDKNQFRSFSLQIQPGEKVLCVGPSGCGKSTLLQVLSGMIPEMIQVPMKATSIHIPANWGYVFQDPESQFCMPMVDEEIAFSLENIGFPSEKMPEKIKQLLDEVGLNFDDVHTPINELSGGMKQRLALVCVLATDPDVVFLDEPTAMLDPQGTVEMWEKVRTMCADKTVLIVEHKIEQIIDWVDRVIVLDHQGKLVADLPPQQLLADYKRELSTYGIWYPGAWEEMKKKLPEKSTASHEKILHIESLVVRRGEKEVVHMDDLQLHKQDWIVITGENGAGKSSLLLALMNFLPQTPTVHWEQEIKKILVFQNPENQFVEQTVEDEIAQALEASAFEPIKQKMNEILKLFGLQAYAERHPFQLSMGEKRRLSIAAALAGDSDVLLLDEPTFGLDTQQTSLVLKQLQEFQMKGGTILMITHEPQIVSMLATQKWHIQSGGIIRYDLENKANMAASGESK